MVPAHAGHILADGQAACVALQLLRRREGQPAFAVEKFAEAAVFRAAGAANNSWRDPLTRLTPRPPTLEPIFPTDRSVNRDGRDFGV